MKMVDCAILLGHTVPEAFGQSAPEAFKEYVSLCTEDKVVLRQIVEAGGGTKTELRKLLKQLVTDEYSVADDDSDAEFIAYLIQHGTEVQKLTFHWMFRWAVHRGRVALLDMMREKFLAQFNALKTIFLLPEARTLEMTKYLVDKGAVIERQQLAVHEAIVHGYLDILRYLVEECGGATSEELRKNDNQVSIAAHCGHVDVVRYLVEQHGVDPRNPDLLNSAIGLFDDFRLDPEIVNSRKKQLIKYLLMNGGTIPPRRLIYPLENVVLSAVVDELILECNNLLLDPKKITDEKCDAIKRTFFAVMATRLEVKIHQFLSIMRLVDDELDNERRRRRRTSAGATMLPSETDKRRIENTVQLSLPPANLPVSELTNAILSIILFYSFTCGSLINAQSVV